MKKYQNFSSGNFHFLVVKFSVYLNRHVFAMLKSYQDNERKIKTLCKAARCSNELNSASNSKSGHRNPKVPGFNLK